MRSLFIVTALLVVSGCGRDDAAEKSPARTEETRIADPLAARDGSATETITDSEERPIMQAQVVLDRLGFTPGVIDGEPGLSTRNAIAGFQQANSLEQTGELNEPTRKALASWRSIPATRVVTIPQEFDTGRYYPVPEEPGNQAKMITLGYASLDEKLAERFHTTVETLQLLNPDGVPAGSGAVAAIASDTPKPAAAVSGDGIAQPGPPSLFRAGQQLRVPNIGHDRIDPAKIKNAGWLQTLTTLGVGTDQPRVDRIVVSKSKGTLKAFDDADRLVAVYTATMGSRNDPLPLGQWKVNGVAYNPEFNYNPRLFWDADPGDAKAKLPPGPNGPVGVVWIDLSKPHYGIHGTPQPETIGRAESHGCVRLTNWDAARLALMVKPGTEVLFEA